MHDEKLRPIVEEMQDMIRREVASGFADLSELAAQTVEMVENPEDAEALRQIAERLVGEAVAEHRAQEATWPPVTDCDRFDKAFAELEAAGVVCRHNFSCCGNCAAAEIGDEIEAERAKGREIIGCAHYNCQTTENAVEGCGVWLSYGSVLRGERPAVDIGHMIVKAMEAQGLTVNWNGSLQRRIHVALDWKRRLPPATGH